MRIHVLEMDLNDDWHTNIKRIWRLLPEYENRGVSAVFCGFALHYFIENSAKIQNITSLVKALLREAGLFIYSGFDGQKVFDRLEQPAADGQLLWRQDDTVKYSIRKAYKSNVFTGINQAIDVLLPFSRDATYREYLIGRQVIAKYLKKLKMSHVETHWFSEYFPQFEQQKATKAFLRLTDIDKDYLALYMFEVYH